MPPLYTTEKNIKIGGNVSIDVRADISTRGFWCSGQSAFFDVRIFDPNARRHQNKTLKTCHKLNEHEKKRENKVRLLPLFFR